MTSSAVSADDRLGARWDWVRPWLVLLVGLWAVLWPLAVHDALTSPWAPTGEVPSAEQVQRALTKVKASAAVGIPLPALGCALAAWCGRRGVAALLATATVAVVLVSAVLFVLVD